MRLDSRIRDLIAVAASVGANCHTCLQHAVDLAHKRGAGDDEIAAAIEIAQTVRKGAQTSLNKLAGDLVGQTQSAPAASGAGCGCG
jgi:AhpD family alkylhydroperoxidase